jgi:hypothetical protein
MISRAPNPRVFQTGDADPSIITEVDKYNSYYEILGADEIAIVDKDDNYVYSFREDLPKVLEENVFRVKDQKDEIVDLEYALKIANMDSLEKIILGKDFATNISVHWAEFRSVSRPYGDFLISAFPIDRKIPFAIKNDKLKIVDMVPILDNYCKCLNTEQLMDRITARYKTEWEKKFGNWDKMFGKPTIYIR